jgi:hypothetical protein
LSAVIANPGLAEEDAIAATGHSPDRSLKQLAKLPQHRRNEANREGRRYASKRLYYKSIVLKLKGRYFCELRNVVHVHDVFSLTTNVVRNQF